MIFILEVFESFGMSLNPFECYSLWLFGQLRAVFLRKLPSSNVIGLPRCLDFLFWSRSGVGHLWAVFAVKISLCCSGGFPLCLESLFYIIVGVALFNVESDGFSGQAFHKNLHSTTLTQHQVKVGFSLVAIIAQGTAILELLLGKYETLLVGRNTFVWTFRPYQVRLCMSSSTCEYNRFPHYYNAVWCASGLDRNCPLFPTFSTQLFGSELIKTFLPRTRKQLGGYSTSFASQKVALLLVDDVNQSL